MTQPETLKKTDTEHVLSIDIGVPREAVWAEITKTGSIQRPLYNCVMESELRPGAKLRYYSPNKKRVFVVGEVVEVTPPERFVHTYVFTQVMDEPPTLVTWELAEIATGSRVTVTHSGWTDAHKAPEKSAGGWNDILGMLKDDLEGQISLKWRVMYKLMNTFMVMMPKSTTVEEVEKGGW